MCKAGSHALVIGAGSGSEVVGLARVGVNVVAVERDARQFRALTERLTLEAAYPERALQQMAVEEAQVSLFTMLAAKFTKLNPDIEAHFLVASADKEQEKGAELSSSSVSSPVARGRSCLACGQAVVAREESECAKHGCDTGKLHAACLEACAKCGKGFCTAGHKNDHGCQND